ncbi:MAG TPA: hypothetical protein VFA18_12145 [Gemmataceae bacterium]|nr:hypothetical protein [Gemmataceae bacterium]
MAKKPHLTPAILADLAAIVLDLVRSPVALLPYTAIIKPHEAKKWRADRAKYPPKETTTPAKK